MNPLTIHATSWEPASETLGHSVQPATVLENNGKLQKSGGLETTTLEESVKHFSETIKPTPIK